MFKTGQQEVSLKALWEILPHLVHLQLINWHGCKWAAANWSSLFCLSLAGMEWIPDDQWFNIFQVISILCPASLPTTCPHPHLGLQTQRASLELGACNGEASGRCVQAPDPRIFWKTSTCRQTEASWVPAMISPSSQGSSEPAHGTWRHSGHAWCTLQENCSVEELVLWVPAADGCQISKSEIYKTKALGFPALASASIPSLSSFPVMLFDIIHPQTPGTALQQQEIL